MSEDFPPNDHREIAERLDLLEELLSMQARRLHAIEERLGIEFRLPESLSSPKREGVKRKVEGPAPHSPQAQAPPPLHAAAHDQTRADAFTPPPATEADPHAARTEARTTHAGESGSTAAPRTWSEENARRARANADDAGARSDSGARAWASGAQTSFASESASAGVEKPRFDLENLIGGSWFNWIGIIAVTFGVAFFLKYAFENDWIGPAGRVTLGGAAGFGIIAAAERLRARGLRQYAYVLTGGGILILYLSVYAAFAFYQLIGQLPAFALMAGVTALAVLLSARYHALPIAVLGLIGGFLTPVLLSTGTDNEAGLFTYVALLDAGVLALAYFKRWRSLNFMSFAGTVLMFAGWMDRFYEPAKLWPTVFFLSLFFLLFSLLPVVHNVLRQRRARWLDISLVIAAATLYFGTTYTLLEGAGRGSLLGSFAVLVSAFYLLLYYTAHQRHRADRLLVYSFLGAGITFFTMAVAIQLELHWVTIAWATEAVVLTWIGLRSGESAPRHAMIPVLAFAVGHWLMHDMSTFAYREGAAFTPLLNERAASCAALVGACVLVVWLYKRAGAQVDEEERNVISSVLLLAANLLSITLLTLDANDYFEQRKALTAGWSDDSLVRGRLENTRQFTLSAIWTLYGAAGLVFGILRRLTPLRCLSLALLGSAVVKVIAFDLGYYDAVWHITLFNQTFVTLLLLAAALVVCARAYARAESRVQEQERAAAVPVLLAVANLLALAALSAEAMGYFNRRIYLLDLSQPGASDVLERLEGGRQFALSVVWTLYGTAAFWFGVARRRKALRYGGLALLALAALKVMSLDTLYSAAAWHAPVFNQTFGAYALVVAAFAFVAWVYGRADWIEEKERALVPALVAFANLLAVVGLSAEAYGYFEARVRARRLAGEGLSELRLAQQLALSVIWTIYGGALLLYGHLRGNRLLRLLALLLLGVTTVKVFLLDLAALDRIYKVVSFLVLGLILLAVSYLYQKNRRRAAEAEG